MNEVKPYVKSVGELNFKEFSIPNYQRPYKWTAKNVNQLINDLLVFKDKKHYRLGTLVLHRDNDGRLNIVDGQQRIVTLFLLLSYLLPKHKGDNGLIADFEENITFSNPISIDNLQQNWRIVETRADDLNEELLQFILHRCEFVVVELNDISEAFQFFDSQNARGKDLEAHDLLKAYHLREIPKMSEQDTANLDFWQAQPTHHLKKAFQTLFRAKYWVKGKSANAFTKRHVELFKGISPTSTKRYPFYDLELMAHTFVNAYNSDTIRTIDQSRLEFPYNLDDQIINGGRFFDMIRHYIALNDNVLKISGLEENVCKMIELVKKGYDGSWRTGDQYVKDLFCTALLYYIDRFGHEELNRVIPKLFVWAYSLRLRNQRVAYSSVDNHAKWQESMFSAIHNARTPYDIINIPQDSVRVACTKCGEVKNIFKQLNKIVYNNDECNEE